MNFQGFSRRLTGVLVPLSALRTGEGFGVGEFADLVPLARWCASAGLDLIQLLPLNDTGWQSSPYSALSAFALHPIYTRITNLPEIDSLPPEMRATVEQELSALREAHEKSERLDYSGILAAKRFILRRIFYTTIDRGNSELALEQTIMAFVEQHPWVRIYAAYKALKYEHKGASWKEWSAHRHYSVGAVSALWQNESYRPELLYFAWLQLRADEQLRAAAELVAEQGILLKGDLPILINDDSADAWAHGEYFSEALRAGAPPDGENPRGQNWGLPVYNWDALRRDGFVWWRNRLTQADRYYSAFRIDHVLGFFRVWSVPASDESGVLGHFEPSASATLSRLADNGFDEARVRWLAEPHLSGEAVREICGEHASWLTERALVQLEGQDLYRFSPAIQGERDLRALDLPEDLTEWLVIQWRDRALIEVRPGEFTPAWLFGECSRLAQLSPQERERFAAMAERLRLESEKLWEAQGREIMSMMRETTEMVPCAEDLGAIPDCVPGTLAELRVLSLRIPRWSRLWNSEGQPFIRPEDYPFLSVCAPSVHDTSTMRQWWQPDEPLHQFWQALGLPGDPPPHYDAQTARLVTEALLHANSAIVVFQLQDLLCLVDRLPAEDPASERVNVPGTMSDWNWGYRMNVTLEELQSNRELAAVMVSMTLDRRRQSISAG